MGKYLFIIPRMGSGGAERMIAYLANILSRSGNTIEVHTFVNDECFYPLDASVIQTSANILINRHSNWTRSLSEIAGLPKAMLSIINRIKEISPDIVISFLVEADILTWLCKLTGVQFKHICSERNDPFRRSKIQKWWLKRVYSNCDLLVCQSQRVSDYYSYVTDNRKTVIPNMIDPSLIHKDNSEKEAKIVAVGRLDKQKNFGLLIDAFAEIKSNFPTYHLDIYGEGPERVILQKRIKDLNMEGIVTLKGVCRDVLSQMSNATLFVMTSNYEGFPNALLEAISVGLPVISTDFPTGTAHELVSVENGFIVPLNGKKELIEAFVSILSSKDLQYEMGKSSYDKARGFYSDVVISEWINAIQAVLENKSLKQSSDEHHKKNAYLL